MSFAILENRFAILHNGKDRFAICDLQSVNSNSDHHGNSYLSMNVMNWL